jgi:hypothetical protein
LDESAASEETADDAKKRAKSKKQTKITKTKKKVQAKTNKKKARLTAGATTKGQGSRVRKRWMIPNGEKVLDHYQRQNIADSNVLPSDPDCTRRKKNMRWTIERQKARPKPKRIKRIRWT